MSENLYGEENRGEMVRLQKMMKNMNCGGPRPAALTLKDFKVGEALGKGAYGHVYRVRNMQDGKDYALKQIVMSASRDGVPQSVIREIAVMKRLTRQTHPNVVSLRTVLHTVDTSRNIIKIAMIMEICDWDLHTFLQNVPKVIPEKQAKHIIGQMMKGLDFLHSHAIIHRDLKPQNILVNRDQTVKLADFGLSKKYTNTSAFTTCVVTLWYRAPEVLLQSYYNSTVDMWSIGCIIYEIYNRVPLFPGPDEAQQLHEIFKKLGTPIGTDWPKQSVLTKDTFPHYTGISMTSDVTGMSAAALDFFKRCLIYDPARRMGSRAALGHEFLKLKPVSVKPRVLRQLRFNNL
ncbi:hypothetical protein L5515_019304 [Caenorhabditis briggsae]|uniref:Protein kinase domain-containing protein n=1 Tax=Caenorhabditis briggsae TaxID=6238 RepID=A0AAE9FEE4_CAEBR|nr:hypothetical protein L3Y34_013467 [Caenorhabditis briggsae]UMM44031.1 hypothetical protein L5515_019304 [Caenorhabditis briggsae]